MIHAAAPCPVDVKRGMLAWWGPVIYEYYAASEGGGTLVTPEEWLAVSRHGRPRLARLRDPHPRRRRQRRCPTGPAGHRLHGARRRRTSSTTATSRRPHANRRDGFFTVGDVGYLNDDGYLFLCDRKIDMIISGGANIYPAEIEAVLLTHPKVGDAAVFGIPHADWGEEVKAVVEPAAGVTPGPDLAEEILAFCRDKLAKYKCPRSIDFIAEMPRDPNGKLYKRKLRDPYWQGRERAI